MSGHFPVPASRILTAIPQSDRKRLAGRPDSSWLATLKNDLSSSMCKMSPSWHWTSHSVGYYQQAELRTEVVQAEQ